MDTEDMYRQQGKGLLLHLKVVVKRVPPTLFHISFPHHTHQNTITPTHLDKHITIYSLDYIKMPIGDDQKVFSKEKYQQTRAIFEKTNFNGYKVPDRVEGKIMVTETDKVIDVIDGSYVNSDVTNKMSHDTSDEGNNGKYCLDFDYLGRR